MALRVAHATLREPTCSLPRAGLDAERDIPVPRVSPGSRQPTNLCNGLWETVDGEKEKKEGRIGGEETERKTEDGGNTAEQRVKKKRRAPTLPRQTRVSFILKDTNGFGPGARTGYTMGLREDTRGLAKYDRCRCGRNPMPLVRPSPRTDFIVRIHLVGSVYPHEKETRCPFRLAFFQDHWIRHHVSRTTPSSKLWRLS
jgi:hypothetical protein